jgi:DNA-binding transcriptional LysR family regulator
MLGPCGCKGVCVSELQDIYRLQAFVAIVEEGSLAAAVGRLHITQPALSSRIKLLEEALNCELLERAGKGVRPTPMGTLVYRHAAEIVRRMEDLQRTVDRHLHLGDGCIYLAGGSTAVAGIFPDTIREFRANNPKVQFAVQELETHFAVASVRNGGSDIAVVSQSFLNENGQGDLHSGVEILAGVRDELVLVASPDHPLAAGSRNLKAVGKALLPMHLNSQDMILSEPGTVVRDVVDWEFRKHLVKPRVAMTLRSSLSMLEMVERNIGITVLSRLSIPAGARVEILPVEGLRMERSLEIIGPKDRSLMPAASSFSKLLVQKMRELTR